MVSTINIIVGTIEQIVLQDTINHAMRDLWAGYKDFIASDWRLAIDDWRFPSLVTNMY